MFPTSTLLLWSHSSGSATDSTVRASHSRQTQESFLQKARIGPGAPLAYLMRTGGSSLEGKAAEAWR
jgi:hypothetical protein